ncbi:hypothetical protein PRNP1_011472 [Phytophthora ramorum]
MEVPVAPPPGPDGAYSSPYTDASPTTPPVPIAPHLDPQQPHERRQKRASGTCASLSDAIGANLLMQLIPIRWDGPARKKGDWLPRWDDVYLSLDGVTLRVFESRGRFLELRELEQQDGSGKPQSATVTDKKHCYTVTAVDKEGVGRPHGFCIKTKEKSKPLHLAVDSELERVLWIHLLGAVVEQVQDVLPKAQRRLNAAGSSLEASPRKTLTLSTPRRPRVQTLTLLGTPVSVELNMFYDAWGCIQSRKGNFALLMPSLHPNITLTSNYPPSVPIAGEYHGLSGVLAFFSNLHGSMDVSHYGVEHVARRGDLAVVSGRETIRSEQSGRRFRHLWKHELRFEADGRISHINILADKTAAAVAFANGGGSGAGAVTGEPKGPTLAALPREREPQASTCPPGEIRVVCISGESFRRRKPATGGGSGYKIIIGLNEFPHLTTKAPGPNRSSSNSSRDVTTMSTDGLSRVGSWKSYSTRVVKSSGGKGPFWAETLHLEFSGAVPGSTASLCVDVWSLGVIGDELVGCAKVNLAEYLGSSEGTEEQIASVAVPKWFDIYRAECFEKGAKGGDTQSCGRLELSISFAPYTEEDGSSSEDADVNMSEEGEQSRASTDGGTPIQGGRTPRHRKSFDRLQELHKETGQNRRVSERSSHAGSDPTGGFDMVDTSYTFDKQDTSSSSDEEEMYTFSVASTKFRVYRRYQLIRAIGHGHDHVHQLHLILQLVGSPSPDDMGFVTNMKAKRWMARQQQQESKSLSSVCPNAPTEALDLLSKLLQFDPRKRISVDDAIAHPFLAPCRADGAEMGSERLAESAFDFSFERENKSNMDKNTLRRLIFEDVCHFHPEATPELEQFTQEQERLKRLEEKRRKEEEAQAKAAKSRAGKSWAVSV